MAYQYHAKKLRRIGTGGMRRKYRDKKKAHAGGHFIATKIGKATKTNRHGRGGNVKVALKIAEYANVTVSKGKIKKAKIIGVIESPSNREYTRMNIITKGAVIETDAGKARVTSRPGQHGVVNAVLIQ
jgi:small subunit ribosomal protein S8e